MNDIAIEENLTCIFIPKNALAPSGATHYHAKLGSSDKDRAIKGLVVCYVVWLRFMKGVGVWACSLIVVRMAIDLKYHNTQ